MAKHVKSVGVLNRRAACLILFSVTYCHSFPLKMQFGILFFHPDGDISLLLCLALIFMISPSNVENFKNFVDRLLFSPNQVSLECFRLIFWYYNFGFDNTNYDDCLCGWISAILRRGVKELDLLVLTYRPMLPVDMFTCQSLVTLKLENNGRVKVPMNVCLPNLNSLSLKILVLNFGRIVKHKPRKYFNYVVEIIAPNLVYFKYIDLIGEGYTLSNMSSLEKVHISINPFGKKQ
ncbi:hypothetical protein HRI_003099000 [Hibiscus trionum]|uniref:Uncharacterized protein n=1 Tax=Hibiscus trionum TaxID=183268 RepID=A0A9W7IFN8_HIBTR|nr:hypothetical protein HRI_003099000 [Hibiscus trionum]